MPNKINSSETDRNLPKLRLISSQPAHSLSRKPATGILRPGCQNTEFYILPNNGAALEGRRKQVLELLNLDDTQARRFEEKTGDLRSDNIQSDLVETLGAHFAFTGQKINEQLIQGLQDKLRFEADNGDDSEPVDITDLNAILGGFAA